ncbi:MAG TPA: hypothetical protein VGL70_02660 [Candidatus Binatia bacterium]|jgi:hypothetical protein
MLVLSWKFAKHFGQYWRTILAKAFKDTVTGIFGSFASVLKTALVTVIGWYFLVNIFEWEIPKLTDDVVIPALSIFGAFMIVAAGFFLVRTIATPVLIDISQRQTIEYFEDRLTAKVAILHDVGGSYEQVDEVWAGAFLRMHRIEIKNLSDVVLKNIKVELAYVREYRVPFLPIPLRQMHDRPSDDDIPYRTAFDLNPGGSNFITVVGKVEAAGDEKEFVIFYADRSRPNKFPDGLYNLGIQVTGENITFQIVEFSAEVRDGQLRFQKA